MIERSVKDAASEIHPIDLHVGEKLKQRRKKLGLSQADLGEKVGLSLQQIQKYEQGINRIAASKLYEFSVVMNVPVSYFYDGITPGVLGERGGGQSSRICFNRVRPLVVLLVEDNPADEVLTRKALEMSGHSPEIHSVRDGQEALNYLRKCSGKATSPRPDVMLLDLNIPKMDGLGLLHEIKKDRTLMDIPVVVLTNSINPQDMAEAYRAGASGFIGKSFDVNEFNDSMGTLVKYWANTVVLPSMQVA